MNMHMNYQSRAVQVVSDIRTCFCMYCFLDDHNFINNHPPDLKLVSNDTP
jgi:hypothetical protein